MIAAVLSPGPSLLRTWKGRENHAVTIAVNRALKVAAADWLSAADVVLFQGELGACRPLVGAMTSLATADFLDPTWGTVATWEGSDALQAHQRIRPVQWSLQAALCHAADLGAMQIDVFGADCGREGRTDCAGSDGENRGPDRWAREAEDLACTFGFLAGRGVSVRHV